MYKVHGVSFVLQWIFISFLISITSTKITNTKLFKAETPSLSDFVSSLISTRLSHCTLFIAEVTTVQKQKAISKPESQNTDFSEIVENILRQTSQNSYLLQLSNNKSENESNFDTVTDLHQYRDKCTLGIFVILDYWSTLSQDLFQNVNKWSSILKKDEDYYLYLTNEESASRDLLIQGSSIPLKVKFKSVIQKLVSGEILMRSTCFYCEEGNPKIIQVDWGQISKTGQDSIKELIQFNDLSTLFPDFVINMNGKVMKVSTPKSTTWLLEIHKEQEEWVAKRGVYKIVMDHLMIKYNFTCSFFPSLGDGGTGRILKNGTWVGSVGDIVHENADIGQTTGQTWHRNKVVGYTSPMTYEKLGFTSGEPLPFFSWKAVFWPLAPDVWIGLGLSYLIVNVALYILNRLAREGNKTIDTPTVVSYTWSSILEQDLPITDTFAGHPIRTFIAFWLIYALVITTAYRSKLVSFLAFPNVEKLPTTFEELAQSDFKLALQYLGGAAYQIMRTSTNPTYQKIFNRMELEPVDAKCFQRAIGQRFVCISWITIADFVYRRNLSDQYGRAPLVRGPDSTCFLSVSIIMEKRAIFRTNFNSLILYAADGGLIDRWRDIDLDYVYQKRRHWEREANKTKVSYPLAEPWGALTNNHFKGAYYILVFGIILGIAGFIGERFTYCKVKQASSTTVVEIKQTLRRL